MDRVKNVLRPLVPPGVKPTLHRLRNKFILGQKFTDDITRLHLGCGDNLIPGWANVDFSGHEGVIEHNLTQPVPLASDSIDFIYTEHFIEHITREQGSIFVADCFRLLKKGGVLRISTPNLKQIVEDYQAEPSDEWAEWDWAPATGCQMLNGALRLWGHQFVYDHEEMCRMLTEARFDRIEPKGWGESSHTALQNRETRKFYGDLIVEATK